jgi:hypothetical protein
MLREAAEECRGYYGEHHPGQLSTLLDLIDGLLALLAEGEEPEVVAEAAAAIGRVLAVVQVGRGRTWAVGPEWERWAPGLCTDWPQASLCSRLCWAPARPPARPPPTAARAPLPAALAPQPRRPSGSVTGRRAT